MWWTAWRARGNSRWHWRRWCARRTTWSPLRAPPACRAKATAACCWWTCRAAAHTSWQWSMRGQARCCGALRHRLTRPPPCCQCRPRLPPRQRQATPPPPPARVRATAAAPAWGARARALAAASRVPPCSASTAWCRLNGRLRGGTACCQPCWMRMTRARGGYPVRAPRWRTSGAHWSTPPPWQLGCHPVV